MILFSDEGPQTYLRPPTRENTIINALRASIKLKFYAFVDAGWDGDEWEDIILAGNGERFRLTSNANDMYNDLMSIIDEACLPREDQGAMMLPVFRETNMSPYYAPLYLYETFAASFRNDLPDYYNTVLNYCVDPNVD